MKKRKVLAMLLAFAMTFSLAACGSSGGGTRNRQAVMQQRRVELMKMPFRIMRSQVIRVQKMLLLSGRGTQILRPCRTY